MGSWLEPNTKRLNHVLGLYLIDPVQATKEFHLQMELSLQLLEKKIL